MKINKIFIKLSIILICMIIGCHKSEDKVESKFQKEVETVDIKGIDISEVIKPIDMALNENFMCILSEENEEEGQIFVFDANSLEFLYKFAKKGMGPEETLALDMVKTLRGDTVDVIDQANYKKISYLLTQGGADIIETKYLSLPKLGPLQETYWVNDSILIFNTLNGELITYNDNQNKIIDQVNISSIIEDLDVKAINKIGSFNYSIQNNDVIVGLRFFNELFKIQLNENFQFDTSNTLSISSKGIDSDKLYDNYAYYSYVNAGQKYVFAQYYGQKLKNLQSFPINLNGRDLKYDFILLDRDLNVLHKYRINIDILRAFLDEKRKRIYFFEAFEDFDKLKYINI